jgi:hypothetical protein
MGAKNARKNVENKMVDKDKKKPEDRTTKKVGEKNEKKDMEMNTKRIMEKEKETGKKRQREEDEEKEKEDGNCGSQFITRDAIIEIKAGKTQVTEKQPMQTRKTRAQRKTRVRMEKSSILKMVEMMVDGQVAKVDSIKVQSEDALFGYDSYTYLSWNDFDKVFAMDELSGAVVASYIM